MSAAPTLPASTTGPIITRRATGSLCEVKIDGNAKDKIDEAITVLQKEIFKASPDYNLSVKITFSDKKELSYTRIFMVVFTRQDSKGIFRALSPRGKKEQRKQVCHLEGKGLTVEQLIAVRTRLLWFNVPVSQCHYRNLEGDLLAKLDTPQSDLTRARSMTQ